MAVKSFAFYSEYYELITLLNEEEQKELSLAILNYMFDDKNGNTYYLDRPFTACPEVIKKMGKQCIHADMYRKVALFH